MRYVYPSIVSLTHFNIMRIKSFIFRTPYTIEGLNTLKEVVNRYGVIENFYLISNSNLEVLLLNRYDKDFKERNFDDIVWFLNRYNVSIVNSVSLLNRFLVKDCFSVMKCCSKVSILTSFCAKKNK